MSDRRYDGPPRNRRALEQRLRNVMADTQSRFATPPLIAATVRLRAGGKPEFFAVDGSRMRGIDNW